MSSRKQHAYEVLLRMARVKELQADAALVEASGALEQCREQVNEAMSTWEIVQSAWSSCAESGREIDIARYQLLGDLGQVMSAQWDAANEKLEDASLRCKEVALQSVTAKRYRERVGEHVTTEKESRMQAITAKVQEESVELWTAFRGGLA